MKVSELIAFLQTCPADAEVVTPDGLYITPVVDVENFAVVMTDDPDDLFEVNVQWQERLSDGE